MFVIFDLDGTLIDSSEVMATAFQHAFEAVGFSGPAPLSALTGMQGSPFPAILEAAGLPFEMHEHFKEASRLLIPEITVHAQVVECCLKFAADDMSLALFTGKDRSRTEDILEYFELAFLFDHIVASDDGLEGKPSPEGINYLMRVANKQAHEVVMIGDATNDIFSARAAYVSSIGCLWGMHSEESLIGAGADHIVEIPEQLHKVIQYIRQPNEIVNAESLFGFEESRT